MAKTYNKTNQNVVDPAFLLAPSEVKTSGVVRVEFFAPLGLFIGQLSELMDFTSSQRQSDVTKIREFRSYAGKSGVNRIRVKPCFFPQGEEQLAAIKQLAGLSPAIALNKGVVVQAANESQLLNIVKAVIALAPSSKGNVAVAYVRSLKSEKDAELYAATKVVSKHDGEGGSR